jgi:prepilin peptidase CpaA
MFQAPHAAVWFISAVLVVAAVIDGWKLKVPNWLTYPFAAAGLAFWAGWGGAPALLWSFEGMVLGLVLLLIVYAFGGMGAGDVKLLAGAGAWIGPMAMLYSFAVGVIVGGVMALAMIAWSGQWRRHWDMMQYLVWELVTVRDPVKISEAAAARKPTMTLLPYGIPLTVGMIGYFAWSQMYF